MARIFRALVFTLSLVSIASLPKAIAQQPSLNDDLVLAAKLSGEVARLFQAGKYKEALPVAQRVAEITERVSPSDQKSLRIAWRNLAEIQLALRQFAEAEPHLLKLVRSLEDHDGTNPSLIDALHRLAMVQFAQKNREKAEQSYTRAIQVAEQKFGAESAEVAQGLSFLGEMHQLNGDYKQAEIVYLRALLIREKLLPGRLSPEVAEAVERSACVIRKQRREEDAKHFRVRYTRGNQSTDSDPKPSPISGVLNGKAIRLPRPAYPLEARRARAQGTVVVHIIVDETGRVSYACAVSGPLLLAEPSEASAYGALFSPTRLNGNPIKVTGVITYRFVAM